MAAPVTSPEVRLRRVGPWHLATAGYALFVVAAGGRAAVQLARQPERAMLAYVLSATAAAIYLGGLVLLLAARRSPALQRFCRVWCAAELVAVLAVGTVTLGAPSHFPDPTVWSAYGAGYLFVPLALPVVALGWLHGQRAV